MKKSKKPGGKRPAAVKIGKRGSLHFSAGPNRLLKAPVLSEGGLLLWSTVYPLRVPVGHQALYR